MKISAKYIALGMVALLLGTATLPSLARKKKQVKAVAAEQDTIPAMIRNALITSSWRPSANKVQATIVLPSTCWSMPVPSIPMRLRCIISSRCITHK